MLLYWEDTSIFIKIVIIFILFVSAKKTLKKRSLHALYLIASKHHQMCHLSVIGCCNGLILGFCPTIPILRNSVTLKQGQGHLSTPSFEGHCIALLYKVCKAYTSTTHFYGRFTPFSIAYAL